MTPNILVSCCFCNKLPQTQWLETTQMYYFKALKSKCRQNYFPYGGSGGESVIMLFQLLEVPAVLGSCPLPFILPTPSVITSSMLTLTLLLPSCMDSYDYNEATQIILYNFPISRSLV